MKLKLLLYLSLSIIFFQKINAQKKHFEKGYVVTVKGDTLYGYIKHVANWKMVDGIDFAKSMNMSVADSDTDAEDFSSSITHYNPNELKSFYFNKDKVLFDQVVYTTPNNKNTKKLFGQLLVNGKYCLYRLDMLDKDNKKIFEEENDHIYIVKTDTSSTVLRMFESIRNDIYKVDKDYIPKLKSIIKDSQTLASLEENFYKIMFRDDNIKEIIKTYNHNNNQTLSTLNYKNNKINKSTINHYFSIGSLNTFPPDASNDNLLMLGYFVNFLSKHTYDHYSLTAGIETGFSYINNQGLIVRIPLTANYSFNKQNNIEPFISFGATGNIAKSVINSILVFNMGGGAKISDRFLLSAMYEIDPVLSANRTNSYIKDVLSNYIINIRFGIRL